MYMLVPSMYEIIHCIVDIVQKSEVEIIYEEPILCPFAQSPPGDSAGNSCDSIRTEYTREASIARTDTKFMWTADAGGPDFALCLCLIESLTGVGEGEGIAVSVPEGPGIEIESEGLGCVIRGN